MHSLPVSIFDTASHEVTMHKSLNNSLDFVQISPKSANRNLHIIIHTLVRQTQDTLKKHEVQH